MTQYTDNLKARVPPKMKRRAKESDWRTEAEYVRQMIRAGESNVAALDPRTTTHDDSSGITTSDDVEELAGTLDDIVLLNELSNEPQSIKEVLEEPTRLFQSVLADRLDKLASNEASPVQYDTLEGEYYLNEGE